MIGTTLQVTETIFAFALVVLLVFILKKRKVVSPGDLKKYSKLMTMGILPAVIFLQLSQNPVHGHQFILVLIMFLAGFCSMSITWVIGTLMRLKRETLGMLIITSSFGSSALIGYPLIKFAFPSNMPAMTDAILISELGVGGTYFHFMSYCCFLLRFGKFRGENDPCNILKLSEVTNFYFYYCRYYIFPISGDCQESVP